MAASAPYVDPRLYPGARWYQGWGFWYMSPDGDVNNATGITQTNPYQIQQISPGLALPAAPVNDQNALIAAEQARQAVLDQQAQQEQRQNAFDYANSLLNDYGLSSLSPWAWDEIVKGASAEQVMQSMRKQQAYLDRFKGMAIRQANGLNAISEGEYISFERQAQQLMRAAGMPIGFWDQPDDFANLIGKDVSVNELLQRVNNAYVRVANAPIEVRNAFTNFFGPDGDTAFAAYFLDPDRALPFLDNAVTQAEISGTGARFGVGVNQGMAAQLAGLGVDLAGARQGFGELAQQQGLFRESVSENQDFTMEDQGVKAQFNVDPNAAFDLQRRRETRQAAFSGTSQQALTTQQGLVGAGSARSV